MRRRMLPATFYVLLAALATVVASPALAQPGTARASETISIPDHTAEIDAILRRGQQMELQRRWEEALAHYEQASRRYPGDRGLQRRFELARLHYELGRRYADRSFLHVAATVPADEALDLYAQVLLKIQAHYVEAPNWKDVVERGTNSLEVALSEPVFLQRYLLVQDYQVLEEFRRELYRVLGPRVVVSRTDAYDAVADAAHLAEARLKVPPTAVVLEYLCGAANTLDPYSAYLTPDQLNDVYSQIEGNFVGLGIELRAKEGALLIVRVISGSPAETAGLRSGDRILAVDGQSTRNLSTDEAADLLRGEAGSAVELSVVDPGREARQVVVHRRRVEVPSVDRIEILDHDRGIGYCRLVCFQKTTCGDLDAALWELHHQGMRSLIIDLRGNPGGLLTASVEAADRFIDRGIIVSTRGRNTQEDFTYSAHATGTWRVPLVVLIDGDSASAAEIFAGAIRDHRRGTIVGGRSYGKGSVQGIFPLSLTSAGVRLTTAKFFSPAGRPYSRVGVEPDVVVQMAARPADGQIDLEAAGEDAMLAAALRSARNLDALR